MTQLLTIPAAARRIGCSRGHVYNLIAAGRLRRYDIGLKGSLTRVSEDDVESYIASTEIARPA